MRKDINLTIIEGDVIKVDFRDKDRIAISLSILSLRQWKDRNGFKKERKTWYRATEFGRRAEALRDKVQIGHRIRVHGQLMPAEDGNPKIWETPDGRAASCYELKIRSYEILDESTSNRNTKKG